MKEEELKEVLHLDYKRKPLYNWPAVRLTLNLNGSIYTPVGFFMKIADERITLASSREELFCVKKSYPLENLEECLDIGIYSGNCFHITHADNEVYGNIHLGDIVEMQRTYSNGSVRLTPIHNTQTYIGWVSKVTPRNIMLKQLPLDQDDGRLMRWNKRTRIFYRGTGFYALKIEVSEEQKSL